MRRAVLVTVVFFLGCKSRDFNSTSTQNSGDAELEKRVMEHFKALNGKIMNKCGVPVERKLTSLAYPKMQVEYFVQREAGKHSYFQKMTFLEYVTTFMYSGSAYSAYNMGLAGMSGCKMEGDFARVMIKGLQRIPPFVGKVFSGEVADKTFFKQKYVAGAEILENQIRSSSRERTVAMSFNQTDDKEKVSVLFEIHSTEGRDIQPISKLFESEVVLLPGSRYRVESVKEENLNERKVQRVVMTQLNKVDMLPPAQSGMDHKRYSKTEFEKVMPGMSQRFVKALPLVLKYYQSEEMSELWKRRYFKFKETEAEVTASDEKGPELKCVGKSSPKCSLNVPMVEFEDFYLAYSKDGEVELPDLNLGRLMEDALLKDAGVDGLGDEGAFDSDRFVLGAEGILNEKRENIGYYRTFIFMKKLPLGSMPEET